MKKVLIGMLVMAVVAGGAAWGSQGSHGAKPHWGYAGEGAPEHWGELSPEFAACTQGLSQSPIDVVAAEDIDQPAIAFSYAAVPVHIVNNGHTIKVDYAPGSTIRVDGQTYKLLQFHFHTPSENAVNGVLYPMEAHLVHQDASGKLGVVGILFKEGKANPFLEKFWKFTPAAAHSDMTVSNLTVDVTEMLPANRDYYAWEGSLTTPPCTEGVKWMLLKEPVEVSAEQVQKLERTMHGANNRPVQALNGRIVYQ